MFDAYLASIVFSLVTNHFDESENPNKNFVRILSYLIGLMIMIIQIYVNELFPSSVRKLDAFLCVFLISESDWLIFSRFSLLSNMVPEQACFQLERRTSVF